MPPFSSTTWSMLLVIIALLTSSLVLAASYAGPIDVLHGHNSEWMREDVVNEHSQFPERLKRILRGPGGELPQHYPEAEVVPLGASAPRPMSNDDLIGQLRDLGDTRQLIVLGEPVPGRPDIFGLSAAFPLQTGHNSDRRRFFGFISAMDRVDKPTLVINHGFATVENAPNVHMDIQQYNRPVANVAVERGAVLTARELFDNLHAVWGGV